MNWNILLDLRRQYVEDAVPQHDSEPDRPTAAQQRLTEELRKAVLAAEKRAGRPIDRKSLAERLRVSPASAYAYLNGTTVPRTGMFDRMLDALGINGQEAGRLATLRDEAELSKQAGRRRRTVASTPDAPPRQLPAGGRHFVGRAAELASLDKFLIDERGAASTVLITAIDGTPGVGKTTLALRWAHLLADRYPDGQLYVNLCGFDARAPQDPDHVLHGFLTALGVAPDAMPDDVEDKAARYRSLLADRRVLVVLDNALSATQARPLLPGGPGCLAIVTSRTKLDSLVVREGAHPVALDVLPYEDAAALLAERLGREVTEADARVTRELVDLCARLPLALSVVSARPEPVAAIVRGLRTARDRLTALATDEQDINLRTIFDQSYAALPRERRHCSDCSASIRDRPSTNPRAPRWSTRPSRPPGC